MVRETLDPHFAWEGHGGALPRTLASIDRDPISQRVGAYLKREGLLVRDIENSYLER